MKMYALFGNRAFITDSFQHIIDAMQRESFRQIYQRDMRTFEAKRAVTLLAIEMRMQVLHYAIAGIVADGIFERAASVVDAMNEVMRQEEGYCSGDSRFIHRVEQRFQIEQ